MSRRRRESSTNRELPFPRLHGRPMAASEFSPCRHDGRPLRVMNNLNSLNSFENVDSVRPRCDAGMEEHILVMIKFGAWMTCHVMSCHGVPCEGIASFTRMHLRYVERHAPCIGSLRSSVHRHEQHLQVIVGQTYP